MLTSMPGGDRRSKAKELLDLVGLNHRIDHTPEKLSGGEQQRVAIGVALANSPPLLLADEPTGELDDATAGEVLDLFGTVNKELQTTILIVTHDPNIAYKVGRVVMIKDGKLSTEIRRKVSLDKSVGDKGADVILDEFTIVDRMGRVQIPEEFLKRLRIEDRARVQIDGDKLTIVRGGD